ncbi:sulfur carrier protein ThiS [Psychromonas sp. PT13]|uniref:sulfur carrier protein ThiS n=1 Tax=Psychromonas sp. PT13 TaxID=3439547 RepID=UPI003EBEE2CB
MNVVINENKLEITTGSNIEQLLVSLDKPLTGSALAVNQKIIRKQDWAKYILCEGDQISLFQAIAGG